MNEDNWIINKNIIHKGITSKRNKIIGNTLESCILSIEHNCPMEMDVRLTDQNELILMHGLYVLFENGQLKYYKKITSEDINNNYINGSKCKIPKFKDIIKTINGQIPILIEPKFDGDILYIRKVIKYLLRELNDYQGEYAIHSFYPNIKNIIKKNNPNIKVGIILPLLGFLPECISNYSTKLILKTKSYDFISYDCSKINKEELTILENLKKPILLWNCNHKNTINLFNVNYIIDKDI